MKTMLYPIIWVAIMGLGLLFQAISTMGESKDEIKKTEQNISLID